MNVYGVLEPTLFDILEVVRPVRKDWEIRMRILDEVRQCVQSVEGLRDADVEPFGSFVSNLFTKWEDLDISIELNKVYCISSASKKCKQRLLEELSRGMRQMAGSSSVGGWHKIRVGQSARIPVLKVDSSLQNISCDIWIDNLEGQMKSKFLFWISDIDKRFRDMVLLVKEWAKNQNINNPKNGTFNSYSLCFLVIFHFQTCVPPILPPLQELYPRNAAHDLTGLRAPAEEQIEQVFCANIASYMANQARPVNRSSLAELFVSFLAKFSDIGIKAEHSGICPFTGRWEEIESNMRWLPKTYSLFIEDPFEQPENTARSVSTNQIMKITEKFSKSYHSIVARNQNQGLLLPVLARYETSQSIPRATGNCYVGPEHMNPQITHQHQHQHQHKHQYQHQHQHQPQPQPHSHQQHQCYNMRPSFPIPKHFPSTRRANLTRNSTNQRHVQAHRTAQNHQRTQNHQPQVEPQKMWKPISEK